MPFAPDARPCALRWRCTRPVPLLATVCALAATTRPAPAWSQQSRTALAPGTSAVVGATVITMAGDSVLRNATVVVRGGRIAAVGAASRVAVPPGATRIDGVGKFLIPGLADMHAHLYADEWVADSVGPYELGVYLANGVTTARFMIGTPLHHQLKRAVIEGSMTGPQLWIASPEFTGGRAAHARVVHTPEAAREAVRSVADSGYDFIKLTLDITPEVFDAIVDEARKRRLPVIGHVDPRVGVAKALAAGQQIEHLDNYMESVLADSAPTRTSVSDAGAARLENWLSLDYVDDRKVDRIAGSTARAGGYVTPTLYFFHSWFAMPPDTAAIRARPDYAHIPPKMRAGWERAQANYWRDPPSEARRARYMAVRNRLVRAIVDSGGHIMAGSDGPGGLMGYGWGLHRELQWLVTAGLTPLEALRSATLVPATFLRAAADFGSIAVGKRADLVLLDANPLADIRNTTRIARVAVAGRWFDQGEMARMISEARVRLNPESMTDR